MASVDSEAQMKRKTKPQPNDLSPAAA